MHEYSLASSLLDMIHEHARSHPGHHVRIVKLRIGSQAGVEVDLLRTAWENLVPGTICATAQLEIINVPATWQCLLCGTTADDGSAPFCENCQFPARLLQGDELHLDRIELVPDEGISNASN